MKCVVDVDDNGEGYGVLNLDNCVLDQRCGLNNRRLEGIERGSVVWV